MIAVSNDCGSAYLFQTFRILWCGLDLCVSIMRRCGVWLRDLVGWWLCGCVGRVVVTGRWTTDCLNGWVGAAFGCVIDLVCGCVRCALMIGK